MSMRHDDDPVEHDPTGIRELLSRLPEPGPMPEHLVARISAALAEEARGMAEEARVPPRTAEPGSRAWADAHTGTVVPLRRRSRWHHVGVAAAVAGVLGIGGLVFSSLPGGVEASFGVADESAGSAAREQARQDSGNGAAGGDAGPADVQDVPTGGGYTTAGLGGEARLVAGETMERPVAKPVPGTVDGADAGAVGTPAGALACAQALGDGSWVAVLADIGTVDGRPAAVLVLTDTTGRRTAYAVERSCTVGAPGLIRGPVPVG
ncbi:MAG: hypothetical protein ACRCYR_15460 [Phycicoccus sp.]